jgi:transcriptional regulator with PAS, ATPase and Fis domain
MPGSRLALVAEDQRFATLIQAHLKKTLGQSAFLCKYEAIRDYLRHDSDGLVLLAATSAADAEQILRLVQEIYLQKLPAVLLVIETTDGNLDGELGHNPLAANLLSPASSYLACLDPYVAGRLHWPADAGLLVELVKERLGRGRTFLEAEEEALEDLIGRRLLCYTPSLMPLVERIALASSHDVTVLLTGETGTGKTFLARLIHECSPRKNNRFLVVPCGALAANLVESEFFGHTKGAFTGADRPKVGKFAAAGNGTLLMDEIDALGLEQQANLLRVIETGEYEPVGSNETQICTARIIVASNWNLEEAVERGKFRRDLYYRLNVMSFHLPPLRERVQDIAPLVRGMAARFNKKFHKDLFDISAEAQAALEAFPWPGNIRQLENVIQQAVLVSTGPELLLSHLPQPVQEYASLNNGNGGNSGDSLLHNREVLERAVIQRALVNSGYSRARAANALGISRVTLYKKMKKYGLMSVPLQSAQAQ